MQIVKSNYKTAKNPFRTVTDAEHIEHFHEVYFKPCENDVLFIGFKLNRHQYWTQGECLAKAKSLAKNIREAAESLTQAEFETACGWFTSGKICGNVSDFMEISHFSGRVQEYATELRELIKLSKLIFGIETFKQGL